MFLWNLWYWDDTVYETLIVTQTSPRLVLCGPISPGMAIVLQKCSNLRRMVYFIWFNGGWILGQKSLGRFSIWFDSKFSIFWSRWMQMRCGFEPLWDRLLYIRHMSFVRPAVPVPLSPDWVRTAIYFGLDQENHLIYTTDQTPDFNPMVDGT